MPDKQRQMEIIQYKLKMGMELNEGEKELASEIWAQIKEAVDAIADLMKRTMEAIRELWQKYIVGVEEKEKIKAPRIPPMKIPYFATPQVIDNRPPVVNIRNRL